MLATSRSARACAYVGISAEKPEMGVPTGPTTSASRRGVSR